MNRPHITLVIALLLMVIPGFAQRGKKKVVPKQPKIEVPEEDPKITEMRASTQQVMFIDSVVIDKKSFLDAYVLNPDAGSILPYNQFFRANDQPYATVYVNQLGNKCFYSRSGHLYTRDMLGKQWGDPSELEGLGHFTHGNYPFMLSDGTTFYFAAISEEGLGGLDIYVSRYDSESGEFLRAENLGMPFNSEANDYMYAIDELDSIGYFATDRRQPEGYVCIYAFIPNQTRRTFDPDVYDEETIRSRAEIRQIADTWEDNSVRKRALARLKSIAAPTTNQEQPKDFKFVVNDQITYTSLADFRDPDNRDRMNELLNMKKKYTQLSADLQKSRNYYAKATAEERVSLKKELADGEQQFYKLEQNIHILEKAIRNAEIKALKP